MATLRLLTLLALTVFCSLVIAQNKPCEPCDASKCPLVILEFIFLYLSNKNVYNICRPRIKNVLLD